MNEFQKREKEEQMRRGYTESQWSEMKRRLNLQMIGAFIRCGGEKTVISNDSFCQREADALSELELFLNDSCPEQADGILDQVLSYSFVLQEIYFNLGMMAGVSLHTKLSDNFETDISAPDITHKPPSQAYTRAVKGEAPWRQQCQTSKHGFRGGNMRWPVFSRERPTAFSDRAAVSSWYRCSPAGCTWSSGAPSRPPWR